MKSLYIFGSLLLSVGLAEANLSNNSFSSSTIHNPGFGYHGMNAQNLGGINSHPVATEPVIRTAALPANNTVITQSPPTAPVLGNVSTLPPFGVTQSTIAAPAGSSAPAAAAASNPAPQAPVMPVQRPANLQGQQVSTAHPFGGSSGSSEVVSGGGSAPATTAAPATTSLSTTQVMDFPNHRFSSCNTRQNPWSSRSLTQKVQKIVGNVAIINRLHGINVDPRFMLCLGYKESTFNPWAASCSSNSTASGLFQVTLSTARDTLGRANFTPRVSGFTGINGSTYHARMAQSSLAQTEMSMLVILAKADLVNQTQTLRNGSESTASYARIANAYYGLYSTGRMATQAANYTRGMDNCYTCMKANVRRDGTGSNLQTCLNRVR